MNAVVMRNREFGPEVTMELAEERAPRGFSDIKDVTSRELEEISRAYKRRRRRLAQRPGLAYQQALDDWPGRRRRAAGSGALALMPPATPSRSTLI